MGRQLPKHRHDSAEPTHTGTRPSLGKGDERERSAAPSGASRTSIRPSAFGLPRMGARAKLPAAQTDTPCAVAAPPTAPPAALDLDTQRAAKPAASPELRASSGPPSVVGAQRRRAAATAERRAPAARKADIEELLPISQAVKSLPRPPRLPALEAAAEGPTTRRFPWSSLAVFAVMLTASAATIYRYSELHAPRSASTVLREPVALTAGQPLAPSQLHTLRASAGERDAVQRIAAGLWVEPTRMRETLLAEGEHALEARDERLAEVLFGRALELDSRDARAEHGLARVRLAQGDLEGAEGWLLSAIAKQPREPSYRTLHADVLDERGRHGEAEIERALARSLADVSGTTPRR